MAIRPASKLVLIKSIHTLIWAIMVCIIAYVVYSGVSGDVTVYSWLAVAAVITEGLVLWMFKGKCPLTVWARNYSDSQKDNFDIYLPEWLARYNKLIFTAVFGVGLVLMLWQYV
jgi:hypothetical protein